MNQVNTEVKMIKNVFVDYSSNSFAFSNAEIENVNLHRKTNKLEIFLNADNYIDINEISNFEKYAIKRFNVSGVDLKIHLKDKAEDDAEITENEDEQISSGQEMVINKTKDENPPIYKEWPNILSYFSSKNPMARAFLRNSELENPEKENLLNNEISQDTQKSSITSNIFKPLNNTLNIHIKVKGKDILEKQGMNTKISNFIKDIYGVGYKVNFIEENCNEYEKLFQEKNEDLIKKYVEETKILQAENSEKASNSQNATNSGSSSNTWSGRNENSPSGSRKNSNNNQAGKGGNGYNKSSSSFGNNSSNGGANNGGANNNGGIPPQGEPAPQPEEEEDSPLIYGRNGNIKEPLMKVEDISVDTSDVQIAGEIVNVPDPTELKKSGKFLFSFDVYDGTSTITCKIFVLPEKKKRVSSKLKVGNGVRLGGRAAFDNFAKEITIIANTVIEGEPLKKTQRMDNAEVKRVELHMHTQMSQMDAVTPVKDLIKRAMKWGMKSIAITDHGVVQSFPDAHKMLGYDNKDIKVIYGVEAYLVPDKDPIVTRSKGQTLDDTTYCVFDLETTGISFRTEKITEIGIMKVRNGEVIDSFETFVNPEKPIPMRVQEITHITDEMVKDAPTIEEIMPKVLEFFGDSVLVAHNADFDTSFIKYNCDRMGLKFDNTYLDTLRLAKDLFPDYKKYKLGIIAENLGIKVEVAHRALDDVDTTVKVFNVMLKMLKDKGIKTLEEMDKEEEGKANFKKLKSYHAIILAKDYIGLRNLYRLVSISHVSYFYKRPLILKSLFKKYSEGLILGSACDQGELYQAILNGKSDEDIEQIARDYDYLEIQPIGNDEYLVRNGTLQSDEDLKNIVRKIVDLGEKLDKPVCATCDVHFMDPQDEIYRRILQAGQGYDDADMQAPLYLRTTEEMLEEFSYLGKEKAYEVVVTNTNKISDMCERISPISPEKCPPHIPGCEETIKNIAYDRAHELYGDPLPKIVQSRLDKELDSIIKNGFSVMYIIAQKLVWKSNEDGYIVGSRGSVGSSFVANMTGITEVNSLPPHYRCPKCKYSDFTDYGVKNGFDLPDKICPKCGHPLDKDGMDIPFETFLGFNGDKEPDIDLNFSGEYQAKAHKYTEVIFGKGTTFKAGTVGTVADKTAFGYVKKYYEERGIPVSNAEVGRVAKGCTGIKRTTGQHPGGIIVVPKGREIYEFTPVQHPADDPESDIITTHFDYHSIDQNLLKLDILGHDDPTVIRMLYDLTGFDPTKVPLDDKATMSIYSSTEGLGVTPEQIHSEVGTYGIPESGTKFVRGMLKDTKPTTFEELLRISGLSHGTDVWLGNAQELINNGTATLSEVICTRDDIMLYLIKQGLEPNTAFKIMELVRKGKVAKEPEKWAKFKATMEENNVPKWYIDSCNKIKYLFPKAHAAAYVTNAFRIAWFKVHIPKAYYCAYFSIRADAFDSDIMCHGKEKVKNEMKRIELLGKNATQKDSAMYETLEIVNEMYERGISFLPIDLYESSATRFRMEDEGIRPPLNSIPGFGTVAAQGVEEARKDGEFMSINDLKLRAKLGKSGIEMLSNAGCLKGMSESNQMSLFA